MEGGAFDDLWAEEAAAPAAPGPGAYEDEWAAEAEPAPAPVEAEPADDGAGDGREEVPPQVQMPTARQLKRIADEARLALRAVSQRLVARVTPGLVKAAIPHFWNAGAGEGPPPAPPEEEEDLESGDDVEMEDAIEEENDDDPEPDIELEPIWDEENPPPLAVVAAQPAAVAADPNPVQDYAPLQRLGEEAKDAAEQMRWIAQGGGELLAQDRRMERVLQQYEGERLQTLKFSSVAAAADEAGVSRRPLTAAGALFAVSTVLFWVGGMLECLRRLRRDVVAAKGKLVHFLRRIRADETPMKVVTLAQSVIDRLPAELRELRKALAELLAKARIDNNVRKLLQLEWLYGALVYLPKRGFLLVLFKPIVVHMALASTTATNYFRAIRLSEDRTQVDEEAVN